MFYFHVNMILSIVLTPDEMRRILGSLEPPEQRGVIVAVLDDTDDDSMDDLWVTLWSAGSTVTGLLALIYKVRGWNGFFELYVIAASLVNRLIDHAANTLAGVRRWWAGDQSATQTAFDAAGPDGLGAAAAYAGYRNGGVLEGAQSGLLVRWLRTYSKWVAPTRCYARSTRGR